MHVSGVEGKRGKGENFATEIGRAVLLQQLFLQRTNAPTTRLGPDNSVFEWYFCFFVFVLFLECGLLFDWWK
jgi:hypothetical protein